MDLFRLLKKAPQVGAFFVFVAWGSPVLAFCPLPEGNSTVRVQRVIDGDTLRLADGRRVRLIGINTPELGRPGRPAEPFAEAARERLRQLVFANGGQVSLVAGIQAVDHYGRTLAHAYDTRGDNWAARLLADGLGFWVAVAPNLALVDCLALAEREARKAGRGLWRRPRWQSSQQLRGGGFALVQGVVRGLEYGRSGLWIDLDGALVLHVGPDQVGRFGSVVRNRLIGRHVRVRGWVLDRSSRGAPAPGRARWMLPLSHPLMLEVWP